MAEFHLSGYEYTYNLVKTHEYFSILSFKALPFEFR